MIVHNHPLDWYVEKLKNREYFSQGMYGDGEWLAVFHDRIGGENAEGTVYTKELCDALAHSLHYVSPTFYFSTPEGLRDARLSGIGEARIDKWLKKEGLEIEFVEKDCWNTWTRLSQLQPFINQLRQMNVCIISNKALRGLTFLNYDHFIEIGYPNCFSEIDRVVEAALEYGKSGVYLISAGLPAAIIAQRLHERIPESWFLDLGSIWDAFVGIGAQRGWRAELYANPTLYEEWKVKSLEGVYGHAN